MDVPYLPEYMLQDDDGSTFTNHHDDTSESIIDEVLTLVNTNEKFCYVCIDGSARSGKSTILQRLHVRLGHNTDGTPAKRCVITSCSEKSVFAMKKYYSGYTVCKKTDKECRFLLIDNINRMSTTSLKNLISLHANAKVIAAGDISYQPYDVDMRHFKWKTVKLPTRSTGNDVPLDAVTSLPRHVTISKSKSGVRLSRSEDTHGAISIPRHIKMVKSSTDLATHNVSASKTGVYSFRSIDSAYSVDKNGTYLEIEDSYIGHYLDISCYIPRILKVGVGDYVMFRSMWSTKFGDIGIVESISDHTITVICKGEKVLVTRLDEEVPICDNIVYMRSQFPLCLANAIMLSDMEGLILDCEVRMQITSSWTEKDKVYAQSHIATSTMMNSVPPTPSSTPETINRIPIY